MPRRLRVSTADTCRSSSLEGRTARAGNASRRSSSRARIASRTVRCRRGGHPVRVVGRQAPERSAAGLRGSGRIPARSGGLRRGDARSLRQHGHGSGGSLVQVSPGSVTWMKTQAQAMQDLADVVAEEMAIVSKLTPRQAAERAWDRGGPSVEELTAQIEASRAAAAAARRDFRVSVAFERGRGAGCGSASSFSP